MVYQSDCRYLPYSIHVSDFVSIFFTRKLTKYENNLSPPFWYDTKMTADGYWARKTLILRAYVSRYSLLNPSFFKIESHGLLISRCAYGMTSRRYWFFGRSSLTQPSLILTKRSQLLFILPSSMTYYNVLCSY